MRVRIEIEMTAEEAVLIRGLLKAEAAVRKLTEAIDREIRRQRADQQYRRWQSRKKRFNRKKGNQT